MKNILLLKEISKDDIPIVGGKGANLGEMFNAGFNVPEAFVVSAQAYDCFLGKVLKGKIAKELNKLNIEDSSKLDKASKNIQALIEKARFSEKLKKEIETAYKQINDFVAVRSSATTEDLKTASFAGMQATFLNIKGASKLIKHVQKCWASLFTSRAIYYRTQNNFDHLQAQIAVVVQRMVNSDTSGVCFTVNPVNNNKNDIVIEASFGLGEAVVAGEVTPDMYVVHKDTLEIHTKNVNEQTWGYFKDKGKTVKKNVKNPKAQVLTDKQIKQVAELAKKIEKHYNHPQDIEFGFEKDKLYLLQARPITTLYKENENDAELQEVKQKYSELVHLDLPLSLVELHYEQESASSVPWTKEKFEIKPYIFYERKNNLVYLFYDEIGITWQMRTAGNYQSEKNAIAIIKKKYDIIKNIIEKEKTLDKKNFFKFINDLRDIWPWMNYMWWAIEYKDKKKDSIKELIKIRKYTEYFTPGIIAVFKKSLKNFLKIKKKYVDVVLLNEIESGSLPEESILDKRLKYFVYTDYQLFNSTKDVFEKYNISLVKEEIKKGNLSGQTAFPGFVKGKVRIITKRIDLANFKEGEILVASTTTPDYLSVMKKSAAIISEHGGVICHAAIVSRELKIPCIVGTKYATKILKDGDLVEVNANKGIVKILKRA